MKFIIRIMPYGWYTGISEKYHDMFQCSSREFAKKFDSKEEAERIANPLVKVGYDVTIVELQEEKGMHITLTETFDQEVDKAISVAKANGLEVWFERDGTHGTSDLEVIVKFQKAGFAHKITTYKGKHDDQAIRVIFHPIEK